MSELNLTSLELTRGQTKKARHVSFQRLWAEQSWSKFWILNWASFLYSRSFVKTYLSSVISKRPGKNFTFAMFTSQVKRNGTIQTSSFNQLRNSKSHRVEGRHHYVYRIRCIYSIPYTVYDCAEKVSHGKLNEQVKTNFEIKNNLNLKYRIWNDSY